MDRRGGPSDPLRWDDTAVTQTPAPPRRDPARSLLERIGAEALNPSYAAAHDQRARARGEHGPGPEPGGRPHGTLLTALVVALVGVLVGVLVVSSRAQSRQVESERGRLVALAAQQRAEVDRLTEQIAARDAEVARLSEQTLASEAAGSVRAEQIASLGVASAVTAVSGPGALVVVEDAADPTGAGTEDLGRVLDIDLQQVVNGLWQAGAEAVAINGERIGALTAIRSAEDVVLVNYVPVVSPYEVRAIGDPRTLPTEFLRSDGGAWLQAVSVSAGLRFGIDSVRDDMLLPAAPVGQLRYATPAPGSGPVTGSGEGPS